MLDTLNGSTLRKTRSATLLSESRPSLPHRQHSSPTSPVTQSTANSTPVIIMTNLTVNDLPLPGTRGAPKKFKGKYSDVDRFLYQYERLCNRHNVVLDREKIENISQYCSRKVREVLEGLPALTSNRWSTFKNDIRKFYEADRETKRYKLNDVEIYVRKTRQRPIKNLEQWNHYNRGFIRIVGWLRKEQRISERETNFFFWKGIHKAFRQKLENRILIRHPTFSTQNPFTISMVCEAAESLLSRDRFDNERLPSDEEDDTHHTSDTENESDSDSSEEDSDSELDEYQPRRKHSHSSRRRAAHEPRKLDKSTRKVAFQEPKARTSADSEDSDADDGPSRAQRRKMPKKEASSDKSTPASSDQEVEELINRLSRMSVSDPAYAGLYFRACTMNMLVKDLVPPPVVHLPRTMSTPSAPPAPPRGFARQPPPHQNGTAPVRREDRHCFGCGNNDHSMTMCQPLQDLVKKGVIKRGPDGRYVYANGDMIFRTFDEPIVHAVERAQPAAARSSQSNYISVSDEENDQQGYTYAAQWDDDGYAHGYWSDEEEEDPPTAYAAGADRPRRTTTSARKERLEKEYEYAHKAHRAQKPERSRVTKPRNPDPPAPSRPIVPTPVAVQPTAFDPMDDDQIMEDLTNKPAAPVKPTGKGKEQPKAPAETERARPAKDEADRRQPRRSEIQEKVKPTEVLQKVLNTPVTMAMGELLAVSKEMSAHVQDVIKPKSAKTERSDKLDGYETTAAVRWTETKDIPKPRPALSATIFSTRTRGQLIRLTLECLGRPISAIIDTGSQLNIVSYKTWKAKMGLPMDITRKITMNDANGGEGTLEGLVNEVPLACGGVRTMANIYVGSQAPFDLLLGRPWQRGNYVSIDERLDGTYLLFKNRSFQVNFELLVTPDEDVDPRILDYIDHANSAMSMLGTTDTTDATLDPVTPPSSDTDGNSTPALRSDSVLFSEIPQSTSPPTEPEDAPTEPEPAMPGAWPGEHAIRPEDS